MAARDCVSYFLAVAKRNPGGNFLREIFYHKPFAFSSPLMGLFPKRSGNAPFSASLQNAGRTTAAGRRENLDLTSYRELLLFICLCEELFA
ncbi:hypothetical protein, partial [uncultured Mailhella sp.]|uniref:hypothetical protein n=1 Tax=uncultured Mailhella sp. TaxID=1981031 RepID=UPI0025F1A653